MDPNPSPHPSIAGLDHHDFRKCLGPDAFETLEVRGAEFQPGAGVHLSDDRTGQWTTHPKDVTVVSPSRFVVERATHADVPAGGASGERGPVAATLRVTVTCPNLSPVNNSFTIEFLDT
jgi:hypothetical protein